MKILQDHWLDVAIREPIPGGATMNIRRFLVIHFTSGATAKSSISCWRTKEARGSSAHFVIDRDGAVFQCRPCNVTAGHAGASRWKDPKTGNTYFALNQCSLGIELANAGDDARLGLRWSKLPLKRASHKNGGPAVLWEQYPEAQLSSCFELAKTLVARYNLDDVVGHEDIAPSRKNDPGPLFPMNKLRAECGMPPL